MKYFYSLPDKKYTSQLLNKEQNPACLQAGMNRSFASLWINLQQTMLKVPDGGNIIQKSFG
jgi:hypothetical protein